MGGRVVVPLFAQRSPLHKRKVALYLQDRGSSLLGARCPQGSFFPLQLKPKIGVLSPWWLHFEERASQVREGQSWVVKTSKRLSKDVHRKRAEKEPSHF